MTSSPTNTGIVLYQSSSGSVEVRLEQETVWLSQKQMASLFGKDVRTVSEHLKNIFKDGELKSKEVIRDFRIAAADGKMYNTQCYNLDAILSVGYRVSSKQGTQFRIWATKLLKQHLLEGYTFHRTRLQQRGIKDFERAVTMIRTALEKREALPSGEVNGLLSLIAEYARSWLSLKQYDDRSFPKKKVRTTRGLKDLDATEARRCIAIFRGTLEKEGRGAVDHFGEEHTPDLLETILRGSDDALMSTEERAAELFYDLITKTPFKDGNKRIGSLLFLHYLSRHRKQEKPISDAALTALALLIAQSRGAEKEVILRLVETLVE